MFLAPELRDIDRDAEHDRGPQPDTQRAAHQTGLARAECLRGQRGDRGDRSHAEDESDEQDQVRETDGGNGLLAEAPDQCEIGRHHGDLAKLCQRDRPCELDRFDHVGTPRRAPGLRRRSGSDDGPGQCHGAAP